MDIEHCLIVQELSEFARFEQAADKTLIQRLLNMSATLLPQKRASVVSIANLQNNSGF